MWVIFFSTSFVNNSIRQNNEAILAEVAPYFQDKDLTIVAKGPSCTFQENGVGINQAVAFTNLTFLFMNDFFSLFGIEHLLPKIKYVFMPDYPHSHNVEHLEKSDKDFTYKDALRYMEYFNFTGKTFVYQIQSTFSKHKLYRFDSDTTTDIPVSLLTRHFRMKAIHTYGYGMGTGYHPSIISLIKKSLYWAYPYTNYSNLFERYTNMMSRASAAFVRKRNVTAVLKKKLITKH